jgi:SHS2 domain-containing protein
VPYRYLEDVAIADVAFEAWAGTRAGLFAAAADAVTGLMVERLSEVAPKLARSLKLADESLEMLLFKFLQEFVYLKDAERLLLRVDKVKVEETDGRVTLDARLLGEKIDPKRHRLGVDVKAITLHQFEIIRADESWRARVVVDV